MNRPVGGLAGWGRRSGAAVGILVALASGCADAEGEEPAADTPPATEVPASSFDPQVEQWEREAQLEGNARTHSTGSATSGDPAGKGSSATDAGDDEFVPGSRHMPL